MNKPLTVEKAAITSKKLQGLIDEMVTGPTVENVSVVLNTIDEYKRVMSIPAQHSEYQEVTRLALKLQTLLRSLKNGSSGAGSSAAAAAAQPMVQAGPDLEKKE